NVWVRSRIIDIGRVSFGRIEGSASRWQGKSVTAHRMKCDQQYLPGLMVAGNVTASRTAYYLDTTRSDR
ncbi:MAG: hypothetical protein AB7R89_18820, partial [Dehalococcoidia bacterium]